MTVLGNGFRTGKIRIHGTKQAVEDLEAFRQALAMIKMCMGKLWHPICSDLRGGVSQHLGLILMALSI
jgi:hypothetical protein